MNSRTLTNKDIAIVKALLMAGWIQSDIASLMGCNGGRIAEVNTGKRGPGVKPADLNSYEARGYIARLHVEWTGRIGRQLRKIL